jgi:hypothetical protein
LKNSEDEEGEKKGDKGTSDRESDNEAVIFNLSFIHQMIPDATYLHQTGFVTTAANDITLNFIHDNNYLILCINIFIVKKIKT